MAPPKKKPQSSDQSPNGKTARAAAIKKTGEYMHAPNNRAQVIQPPGAAYPEGTDGWFMLTKGRFRAADKVYAKSYKETKSKMDAKNPAGAKESKVSKVSKASKKK